VAGNAQAVSQTSNEASRSAQDGAQKVLLAVRGMERIGATVGAAAGKVQEMGKRTDQINAIVETIEDIASQTNMLALNAAIEAARAGESGRGFAVVAEEVRKLAERAAGATREIGGLVRGIQSTAAEAVTSMQQSGSEVESGMQLGAAAGSALEAILKAVEDVRVQAEAASRAAESMNHSAAELVSATDRVSAVVEENTAMSEQMAASVNEVARTVENIASVSEENSAAVEEVTASVQEISAQAHEVATSAATTANIVRSLDTAVAAFQLE
jgi:methyl-accepting chemotaxis protein